MDSESLSSAPKPIFLVTHPRAVSTAFEMVFLAREDDIVCVHEPFSDAYHWGPERLSQRYENVEQLRKEKGLENCTYQAVLETIKTAETPGKRVFIKDMGKTLLPLHGAMETTVPSLRGLGTRFWQTTGVELPEFRNVTIPNPTLLPREYLAKFHFSFLIRTPRLSIPSLYECALPPKSFATGWDVFKPEDAGYKEIRILFDYLVSIGQIGPNTDNEICIIDAEDLLAYPEETIKQFCLSVGVRFDPNSLNWGTERVLSRARAAFKNWAPFHDVVLESTGIIKQPLATSTTTPEAEMALWVSKYGQEAAEIIRKSVDDNMEHYMYLKQFTSRPEQAGSTLTL